MLKKWFNYIIQSKENQIKIKDYPRRYNILLLNIFILVSALQISRNSEIHLIVKAKGNQQLLNKSFNYKPFEVIVNGFKNETCQRECYLEEEENHITLRYDSPIPSCNSMFSECENITEIDLSNFDTTNVTDMAKMFNNCKNLVEINFENINTSKVENMNALFQDCQNLKTLNLSMFDTSQVTNMVYMFNRCSNLQYLDISNFDTSKIEDISNMFNECRSLIYLNLYSFKLDNSFDLSIGNSVKFCIKDENTLHNLNVNKNSDCNNDCFKNNPKIDPEKKECIDSCENDGYKYEYNTICYNECPEETYSIFCDEDNCDENSKKCFDKKPKGYYLDLGNKTYKKCYENCLVCDEKGNETIHNCIECVSNFIFYNTPINIMNCYEKCEYYYYFDEYNKFHCTENNRCPKNYKLIKDKNKCIDNCENDDIYKYEYCDKCFMFQPNDTFPGKNNCIYLEDDIIETSENLTIKNNKTFEEERDDYILRFRNYVLHFNVTGDKENIIESKNGVIYQITTLDNQKINSYKNISILDLGDCGNQLISRNITDPNLPLIIFKIDFFPPGESIPIVGYEIYHPLNKNKLDLTGCKIKLKIPVRIDENKLFK